MNKKDILKAVAFATGGAAAGSGVTYFLVRTRLKRKFANLANEEIESVKETYKLLRKEPPYDDPVTAQAAYLERIDELQYASQASALAQEEAAEENIEDLQEKLAKAFDEAEEIHEINEAILENVDDEDEPEESTSVIRNIFDEARFRTQKTDKTDTERFDVLATRDPNIPFVITTDEFMDDENEFDKLTITYFEADDTLCDERESIIPDIEGTVGRDNMHKFGVDSDSKDIVYIRNEKLKTDFEVARDERSFANVVLGVRDFEDDKPRIRRMRDDE